MEKAVNYGADVLVLDLEDSVPDQEKVAARAMVKEALRYLKGKGQACGVRIDPFITIEI
jgi:citrate lyase subunit beta/citryl-CoA lyase